MRYLIKQKLWSWKTTFHILDEQGQPAFEAKSQGTMFNRKLLLWNPGGQVVAVIRRRWAWFWTEYIIEQPGLPPARVSTGFRWFARTYTVSRPHVPPWTLVGHVFKLNYGIEQEGRTVARISEPAWSLADTYGIEIEPGQDPVLLLSTVIVMDQIKADRRRRSG